MEFKEDILIILRDRLEKTDRALTVDELAMLCNRHGVRGHLAVLTQPYISKILSKQKTVESRFSLVRTPPFGRVRTGDVIFLKQSGKPVIGVALAGSVEFWGPLEPGGAEELITEHQNELAVESAFVQAKRLSRFATFIYIHHALPLSPLRIAKLDRRPWVILNDTAQQRLF